MNITNINLDANLQQLNYLFLNEIIIQNVMVPYFSDDSIIENVFLYGDNLVETVS